MATPPDPDAPRTPAVPPGPPPPPSATAHAPTHPPSRRAGRNLPAAIGVGIALGALVLVSLYVARSAFLGVLAVAVVVAVSELGSALRTVRIAFPILPVTVGGVLMQFAAYGGGPQALIATLGATIMVTFVWRLLSGPADTYARDVTAGVFAATYIPFLAAFAALLLRADNGAARIVLFILVTIASDIGGYAAGATLGRRPLAPSVSPKKSWEGLGGSVLACALVGALAGPPLAGLGWLEGALLGLCAVTTATLGDLGESLIKRDLGIKDMGSLLPGHGGLMDRLDSLLPTAPAAFLVIAGFAGP